MDNSTEAAHQDVHDSHEPTEHPKHSVRECFVAELFGTFILIFFGCGAVNAAVAFGAQSGLWQVAIVWGLSIMLAIYCIGHISGAHINPAVTIAMWIWDGFDARRVWPYIAGQFLGAFLAALLLFTLFSAALSQVEESFGVVRGQAGSEITASCFGEFFPNPGNLTSETYSSEEHAKLKQSVPHAVAFIAEVVGTAILLFVVFAVNDERNRQAPMHNHAPVFIGLTVSALISVIAPLTQACFNPARDFGPRLLSAFAGWGHIALPLGTEWGWLTVYIVAPILGGILGGGVYRKIIAPMY